MACGYFTPVHGAEVTASLRLHSGSPEVHMDSSRRRFLAALPAVGLLRRLEGAAQDCVITRSARRAADFPAAARACISMRRTSRRRPGRWSRPAGSSRKARAGGRFRWARCSRVPTRCGQRSRGLDWRAAGRSRVPVPASEGENIVAHALGLTRGDNVVVDELHYNTSFVLYQTLEQTTGVELRIGRPGGRHEGR